MVVKTATHRYDVIYVGFLLGHGGDALQMLCLAEEMQRRGARVKIVVPAGEHSVTFKARCDAAGVECERSTLLVAGMYRSRQTLRSLMRLFRSLDAPVVHFHTGNSILPRSAMAALTLLRSEPAVVTTHSPYETIDAHSPRGRLWAATARRRFRAVVCPSDHASRFQRSCGVPADLVVTIRNTVDVDTMAGGDGARQRAALGIAPDTPVVLFCSRIDKQKRPLDAVRVLDLVRADFPDALLVFLGSGELEGAVRDEAERLGLSDRVRLAGYQTNVPDWLAMATVWLLPTERENFSVAVLEALAAGCPVLATDCPGNDEVLVDGENALTFAVGDVTGAAERLRRLLADAALREQLASNGRATAKGYTVERMIDEYAKVYARMPGCPDMLRPRTGVSS